MKITAKKTLAARKRILGGGGRKKKLEQMATLGQVPDFDNTKEDFDTFLENI